VTLRVLGDGPQRHDLESLAKELGIAEEVKFEGSVSEERIIRYGVPVAEAICGLVRGDRS
jgi:hypothetical protein